MAPAAVSSGQKLSPAQLNALQRSAVLQNSQPMFIPIYNQAWNPTQQPTINVQPRYVGLCRSFYVVITGTINNTDGALGLTLTDLGLANLLSQNNGVVFTDLQSNNRVQTAGWHLAFVNSVKSRKPFASGYLIETDATSAYGENFPVISAPATIAHGANANFRMVYEIPVAYNRHDLRGAIYLGVVNATANIALTWNNAPFTTAGTDSTFAVMKGTAAANFSNVNVEIYQEFLDQLPVGPNGAIVPGLDVSTIYELKTTFQPNIVEGVENPINYSNYRSFLSTFAIFDNNPAADAGRSNGSDIAYWAQQIANYTNLWKKDPLTVAQQTRDILNTDLPKGCYYFSSRQRPIETNQYGNQQLILNPITSVGGIVYLGYEDFVMANLISQAGSLNS